MFPMFRYPIYTGFAGGITLSVSLVFVKLSEETAEQSLKRLACNLIKPEVT